MDRHWGCINIGGGETVTIQGIVLGSSGLLIVILSLIEVSKIKINPWSALAKGIGRAINAEIITKLESLQNQLDSQIQRYEMRNANECRTRILHFDNEILRDIPHTKEEFIEVLTEIDGYEAYCREHPQYKNNRAVHAIANINDVYNERLKKHDFLV